MPKLTAKDRKKVAKSEAVAGGDFEPITPGKYIAELSQVEAKASAAGNPMWVAEFIEIHSLDGERQPGRQWLNLMLPQDTMPEDYKPRNSKKPPKEAWELSQTLAAGRLKAFFEAFGYEVDSDTDEMIGDKCVLQIGIATVQQGPKKGQKTNRVNGIFPLDSVDGGADFGDDDGDGDGDEF